MGKKKWKYGTDCLGRKFRYNDDGEWKLLDKKNKITEKSVCNTRVTGFKTWKEMDQFIKKNKIKNIMGFGYDNKCKKHFFECR